MPDSAGPLGPADITSTPAQSPPGAPPLPLPTTGDVQVSEGGQEQAVTPPGYVPPADAVDVIAQTGIMPGPIGMAASLHRIGEVARRVAAGDGGFKLDADEMRALLPQWQEVRDDFSELREAGEGLQEVTEPAGDDGSLLQIAAAGEHQRVYVDIAEQQFRYAEAYVTALEEAIVATEAADEAAGDAARDAGRDL